MMINIIVIDILVLIIVCVIDYVIKKIHTPIMNIIISIISSILMIILTTFWNKYVWSILSEKYLEYHDYVIMVILTIKGLVVFDSICDYIEAKKNDEYIR